MMLVKLLGFCFKLTVLVNISSRFLFLVSAIDYENKSIVRNHEGKRGKLLVENGGVFSYLAIDAIFSVCVCVRGRSCHGVGGEGKRTTVYMCERERGRQHPSLVLGYSFYSWV